MEDDVEALVHGEGALLATVLDQTHDCIELLSLDGSIQYVNKQGALAMELSSPSELVGQSYRARWPEEALAALDAALAAAGRGELGRFKACRRTSSGLTGWWDVTVSPVRASLGSITHFATIARDLTSEVSERERVEAISMEMHHRLKNALTVAGGIIMLSARRRPDVSEFAHEIVARLSQLGSVQNAILEPGTEKHLPSFVPMIAQAYGDNALFTFGTLPAVTLSDQAMQVLALCFGELATNSLKYGALRNGQRIQIDGTAHEGRVELSWREETDFGSPRVGGQGLQLIERLVGTVGGTFKRDLSGGEMRALISLPAH